MNDNVIMSGIAHHFTDEEITGIIDLFGNDPIIDILEDGAAKDRSRRAKRRKATARHHKRLENIFEIHGCTVKNGRLPNLKKRVRAAKAWSVYDDLRKDPAKQELAEARKIAEYLERKSEFDRLVEAFLNKPSDITIVEDGNVFFDDFDEVFSFNTSTLSDEDLVFVDPHLMFDEAELEYLRSL